MAVAEAVEEGVAAAVVGVAAAAERAEMVVLALALALPEAMIETTAYAEAAGRRGRRRRWLPPRPLQRRGCR